eukprot:4834746-Pyramimonas_sp.AAC.1
MDVPRLIEDDAELGHHINATSDRVMDNKVMTLEYDVVEMILSTAVCGAIYALTSGQPVALTGFGGAHLAFTGVLYSAATLMGVEFLPFFAWVGIWASLFLIVLTLTSASNLVLYFTRFTDETFSALSSVIFVYESTRNLVKPFLVSNPVRNSCASQPFHSPQPRCIPWRIQMKYENFMVKRTSGYRRKEGCRFP